MSYFSRVTLSAGNYQANRLLRNIAGNPYFEHQALWQLFPEDQKAKRDFVYRCEQHELSRVYYLVSQRQPLMNEGAWEVQSKPYLPKIKVGQKLSFNIRVNPVVTRKDENGRSHRHDVVMDAKFQSRKNETKEELPPIGELIQRAGYQWLTSRAECNGFSCSENDMIIEDYRCHKAYKRKAKSPIEYRTLDYKGVLTVTDSERLSAALIKGIGPAKAFGCGLLLVQRA